MVTDRPDATFQMPGGTSSRPSIPGHRRQVANMDEVTRLPPIPVDPQRTRADGLIEEGATTAPSRPAPCRGP